MQTLFVKVKDGKGNASMRKVHVIRSWQDAGGSQIYLHANGTYGYKDGSPVRSKSEFAFIGDPFQRERAEKWWNARGGKLSEEFYTSRERDLAELQKDVVIPEAGDNSDLDAVLYRKRLIKDRRKIAFSPPSTWFEWFAERPAWWGMATIIEIGEFRFERAEAEDEEEEPEVDEKRGHMEQSAEKEAVRKEMAEASGAATDKKKAPAAKADTF